MDKKLIDTIKKSFASNLDAQFVYVCEGQVKLNEQECAGKTYKIIARYQIDLLEVLDQTEQNLPA